ncbi:unnamed protein product, partial [marine sediment metagenome]
MVDYMRKAIRGVGIVFSLSILAAFINYLVRLVLARNLSVEDYGLFYAALALVLFIGLFKTLGLNKALGKFVAEFKVKKRYDLIKNSIISSFSMQFILSGLIALFLIIFSDFFALNYLRRPDASIVIKILAIVIWLRPVGFICAYIFQGFQKMKYYSS